VTNHTAVLGQIEGDKVSTGFVHGPAVALGIPITEVGRCIFSGCWRSTGTDQVTAAEGSLLPDRSKMLLWSLRPCEIPRDYFPSGWNELSPDLHKHRVVHVGGNLLRRKIKPIMGEIF
jgi:hypothetical protein